ncbi:hypothetical protein P3T27_008100 [Kitasatospora sp. MAA19]|nr:hypothetical protein [Kitasatospora sp. MAA19]
MTNLPGAALTAPPRTPAAVRADGIGSG